MELQDQQRLDRTAALEHESAAITKNAIVALETTSWRPMETDSRPTTPRTPDTTTTSTTTTFPSTSNPNDDDAVTKKTTCKKYVRLVLRTTYGCDRCGKENLELDGWFRCQLSGNYTNLCTDCMALPPHHHHPSHPEGALFTAMSRFTERITDLSGKENANKIFEVEVEEGENLSTAVARLPCMNPMNDGEKEEREKKKQCILRTLRTLLQEKEACLSGEPDMELRVCRKGVPTTFSVSPHVMWLLSDLLSVALGSLSFTAHDIWEAMWRMMDDRRSKKNQMTMTGRNGVTVVCLEKCSQCGKRFDIGCSDRYRCQECSEYTLCSSCFSRLGTLSHPPSHRFTPLALLKSVTPAALASAAPAYLGLFIARMERYDSSSLSCFGGTLRALRAAGVLRVEAEQQSAVPRTAACHCCGKNSLALHDWYRCNACDDFNLCRGCVGTALLTHAGEGEGHDFTPMGVFRVMEEELLRRTPRLAVKPAYLALAPTWAAHHHSSPSETDAATTLLPSCRGCGKTALPPQDCYRCNECHDCHLCTQCLLTGAATNIKEEEGEATGTPRCRCVAEGHSLTPMMVFEELSPETMVWCVAQALRKSLHPYTPSWRHTCTISSSRRRGIPTTIPRFPAASATGKDDGSSDKWRSIVCEDLAEFSRDGGLKVECGHWRAALCPSLLLPEHHCFHCYQPLLTTPSSSTTHLINTPPFSEVYVCNENTAVLACRTCLLMERQGELKEMTFTPLLRSLRDRLFRESPLATLLLDE